MKQMLTLLALLTVLAGAAYLSTQISSTDSTPVTTESTPETTTAQTCIADDCLEVDGLEYPTDQLPNEVVVALNSALDDEYKAQATYAAVIDELGMIRPFSMIIRAEEQHISSLKSLYDKYGVEIPENPYNNLTVADTKSENCAVGVQAEIDNAALYKDQLIPAVIDYPDVTTVFTSLMKASSDKHLPAFSKCAN